MDNFELSDPPSGLEEEFNALLTPDAIHFLAQLTSTFNNDVDKILWNRTARKVELDLTNSHPDFLMDTAHIRDDTTWRVTAVPHRLQNRHVDIGDTAPYQTERFHRALMSTAQGIQVDFDDGNCPTFYNQIRGIFNVYQVVHGKIPGLPPISEAPVLMLRPRAWNMVEHNMLINGREIPGPLFDYGLLMYHTGRKLYESECGPFFYLSKVESFLEARLWNQIFVWTEEKLTIPPGSIKATVLIESVLASFEMEEILYELKEHSAGLNCGIWDYSASFVNKFGHRPEFLLPDRSKYVNMEKHFLKSYMDLLVQTCHRRGALATGGMAALLLPEDKDSAEYQSVTAAVTRLKLFEINAGVDGFMVYDIDLVAPMQKLFQEHTSGPNQLHVIPSVKISQSDLLIMPAGGVTLFGLKYNIAVGILFIDAWLKGEGHFFYCGKVEDSATAEISRSQVWQWIRHQVKLEDDNRMVTRGLVCALVQQVACQLVHESQLSDLAMMPYTVAEPCKAIGQHSLLWMVSRQFVYTAYVNFRFIETGSWTMLISTQTEEQRYLHVDGEKNKIKGKDRLGQQERLHTAAELFMEIVLKRDFPEFITTYLNLDHTFLSSKFLRTE